MSVHGSKLVVSEGAVYGNMVVLTVGKIDVAVLDQEYVMYDGKEPVEVQGGGWCCDYNGILDLGRMYCRLFSSCSCS